MKRLAILRKSKNMTQKEVAYALDIKESTYRAYELGNRLPNIIILRSIATYYGVTTDYLLDIDTSDNFHCPDKIETISDAKNFLDSMNLSATYINKSCKMVINFAKILLANINAFIDE